MESKFWFINLKDLDLKVISVPYVEVLLEADFNESNLRNAVSSCLQARPAKVELWLPKFKLDLKLNLTDF